MSNKIKNVSKLSQLYAKSKVPTDELLDKVPTDCTKLREKIPQSGDMSHPFLYLSKFLYGGEGGQI